MTTTGAELVALAEAQFGKPYVFGAEARCTDPEPDEFDCSELVEWVCCRLGVTISDGAYNQWRTTEACSVAEAIDTEGALLFIGDGTGSGRDAITHVAFSRGDGSTAEARGSAYGCGSWTAHGRFDYGGLIVGVEYGSIADLPTEEIPALIGGQVSEFVVFDSETPGSAKHQGVVVANQLVSLDDQQFVHAVKQSSGVPTVVFHHTVPEDVWVHLVKATANYIEG